MSRSLSHFKNIIEQAFQTESNVENEFIFYLKEKLRFNNEELYLNKEKILTDVEIRYINEFKINITAKFIFRE